MKSRRRKTISSVFTDAKLLTAILERGGDKLSPTELDEVTELSIAIESGKIDALAQHTRDRCMRFARQAGALITEKAPASYAEFKDAREAERPRTPGELFAEDVLSEHKRKQALADMAAARRRRSA